MDSWDYLYHIIFFIALLCSFFVLKSKRKALYIFPILLLVGNVIETIVAFTIISKNPNYPFIYHAYIPVEYFLLSIFYYRILDNKWIKKVLLVSIPLFITVCIYLSLNTSKEDKYPTLQFNIEGVLIICWSVISLFSLKAEENITILKHPYFWINIGLLFFYAGNFFLMGTYNSLITADPDLARKLFKLINKTLNYSLYILFIIGFICSRQARKY